MKWKSLFFWKRSKQPKTPPPPPKSKIQLIQEEVDEVKAIMIRNIERALSNMESLESLKEKSEKLKEAAKLFKKESTGLKVDMWFRNFKIKMMIVALIFGIVSVGVSIVLGWLGVVSGPASIGIALICGGLAAAVIVGLEIFHKIKQARDASTTGRKSLADLIKPDNNLTKITKDPKTAALATYVGHQAKSKLSLFSSSKAEMDPSEKAEIKNSLGF